MKAVYVGKYGEIGGIRCRGMCVGLFMALYWACGWSDLFVGRPFKEPTRRKHLAPSQVVASLSIHGGKEGRKGWEFRSRDGRRRRRKRSGMGCSSTAPASGGWFCRIPSSAAASSPAPTSIWRSHCRHFDRMVLVKDPFGLLVDVGIGLSSFSRFRSDICPFDAFFSEFFVWWSSEFNCCATKLVLVDLSAFGVSMDGWIGECAIPRFQKRVMIQTNLMVLITSWDDGVDIIPTLHISKAWFRRVLTTYFQSISFPKYPTLFILALFFWLQLSWFGHFRKPSSFHYKIV